MLIEASHCDGNGLLSTNIHHDEQIPICVENYYSDRLLDGGTTWTPQTSGTKNTLSSVLFTDASTGWVVGDLGTVLHTTDGGTTWIPQASGTSNDMFSVFFTDANTGWVVGGPGNILHTTDGGATWMAQASGTSDDMFSVFFTDANSGWVVGLNGTILHTSDGGAVWVAQTSGTTSNLSSLFFADANRGWAVGGSGTIRFTTDGGTNWMAQTSGTSNHLSSVFFTDPDTGWAVGDSGTIVHTIDGGASWIGQTSGTTNHLYSTFFTDPNAGWVAGVVNMIIHTADGGTNWAVQTSGWLYHVPGIFFTDSNTGWTVGDPGIILHTTDGGTTWTTQPTGVGNHGYSVVFTDQNTGWMTAGRGTIFHTTNSGTTWLPQTSGTPYDLFSIRFTDPNSGWTVGNVGTIIHTTDGGANWTTQTSGTTYNLFSTFFTDANTGFAVGSAGTILHTTDGGTTWVAQTSGTGRTLFSVFFTDANTGWVVGGTGTIRHTTDGGTTWSDQVSGTTNTFRHIYFIDPNIGWAVGQRGITLHTTNGGVMWTPQTSGSDTTLECVFFLDANTGWISGEDGIVLHTTTGGTGIEPPLPPNLSLPPNGSTVSTSPVLSWNAPTGALWHALQVSTSPYFSTYVLNQTNIFETSFQLSGLQPDTTYYWRVSVTDSTGTSGWSEVWSFRTTALPNQVMLIEPEDGAMITSDSALFIWRQSAPDVDRYWFETATDSLFAMASVDSLVTDTTRTVTLLDDNETYWWRVRGHNPYGWGEFSQARSFIVLLPIPCDSIDRFLARCVSGGTVQARLVLLNSTQYAGEVVIISIDSVNYTATIGTNGTHSRAAWQVIGQSLGNHTVTLVNPPGCFSPMTVTCATGLATAQKEEGWDDEWTDVELEADQKIPTEMMLFDNYPDPFNPSTTIRYALSEDAHVTIKVYNMLGQLIGTLVDEVQTAGEKAVVWNGRYEGGSSVSSGIYVYRMSAVPQARPASQAKRGERDLVPQRDGNAGDFVATKRMLLVK